MNLLRSEKKGQKVNVPQIIQERLDRLTKGVELTTNRIDSKGKGITSYKDLTQYIIDNGLRSKQENFQSQVTGILPTHLSQTDLILPLERSRREDGRGIGEDVYFIPEILEKFEDPYYLPLLVGHALGHLDCTHHYPDSIMNTRPITCKVNAIDDIALALCMSKQLSEAETQEWVTFLLQLLSDKLKVTLARDFRIEKLRTQDSIRYKRTKTIRYWRNIKYFVEDALVEDFLKGKLISSLKGKPDYTFGSRFNGDNYTHFVTNDMVGEYHDYVLDEGILLIFAVSTILDMIPSTPNKKAFQRLIFSRFAPLIKYIEERKHTLRNESIAKYLGTLNFTYSLSPVEGSFSLEQQNSMWQVLEETGQNEYLSIIKRVRELSEAQMLKTDLPILFKEMVTSKFNSVASIFIKS
ncbi:MAG: hypothetical protein OHK0017_07660 [Patescibacteria group bacterium]